MPSNSKTFYKILEVDSEASPEVIEAAYRRLARRYHPDLNRSHDATVRMQELNEAYGVLSDSQQRMSYDLYLRQQADSQKQRTASTSSSNSSQPQSRYSSDSPESESYGRTAQSNPYGQPSVAMATACEKCGRSDASLRFVQFPYVVSLVLVTFRRGERGLFCSECRRKKMADAKILTLILGWWGIPFGPIFSLGALFTSSEGVVDAKLNAEYLRYLCGYFINRGDMLEAKKAIQASLNLHHDPEIAATAHAIFGDDLGPSRADTKYSQTRSTSSQVKPKNKWVSPVILLLLVGGVLLALIMNRGGLEDDGYTTSPPTSSPKTVMPSAVDVGNREWTQFESTSGLVKFEYPGDWELLVDTAETIELRGTDSGLTLFVMPGNIDGDIAATIRYGAEDPDFDKTYNEPLRKYLESEFEKLGGGLTRLGNPVIAEVGEYSTISNDIEYVESFSGVAQSKRMWFYFFDCGTYLCQIIYAKEDSSAITKEQQQLAERVIASIVVDSAQSPPAPAPTKARVLPSTFSSLSFCYEREFNQLSKKCTRHRDIFTGTVERLYVSWTPNAKHDGASFLEKWYFNGHFIFDSESSNEYAYIEVDTRESLKPGEYMVDVYVGETLVARGSFEIR